MNIPFYVTASVVLVAAIVGTTAGVIILTTDGFASKHLSVSFEMVIDTFLDTVD